MATINNSINDSVLVTTFLTSTTWNKNARTKWIALYIWNAGDGGASGRQGLTTAAGGGGGGAGGALVYYEAPASFFNSSETVTIASGGIGGVSQGSANSDGNPGSFGGQSLFGNIYGINPSVSGSVASAGTNGDATGGGGINSKVIWATASSFNGGGDGQTAAGNPGSGDYSAGGGGGAGADSITAQQGGAGANVLALDLSTVIYTGGAGGIESGTINGANGTNVSAATSHGLITGGSGGGGGGGQSTGLSAGTGGNGGFPGGGGGGGGGSINATSSGAGGNGANGQIIVIEYF